MKYNKDKTNSKLFLDYIIQEGKFNGENYDGILELGQSAIESLSKYLGIYKQYLLSTNVRYDELEILGIKGAYGYLRQGRIFVPKSFYNDRHFLLQAPKSFHVDYEYNYPSIDEFETIICEGICENLYEIFSLKQDIFLGYCASLDNKADLTGKRIFYENFFNNIKLNNFRMIRDIDSKDRKEFCLIKRR